MARENDDVVLVTGEGSGIGRATSEYLAGHGSNVVVADLNSSKAREAAEAIGSSGGRAAAVECDVAQAGVRVNAVCPEYIETPMNMVGLGLENGSTALAAVKAKHPMNRLGRPEEIAAAVNWLLADSASFVTGHLLSVDGGFVVP
jgi:NAD(P)-dependent dehydrogenase (short-subunit alcohol dehydrogenase family)